MPSEQIQVSVVHQYTGPKTFIRKPVASCCRCGAPVYNVLEWIAQSVPEIWLCKRCSLAPEGQISSKCKAEAA